MGVQGCVRRLEDTLSLWLWQDNPICYSNTWAKIATVRLPPLCYAWSEAQQNAAHSL